jgi:hypothetical protein
MPSTPRLVLFATAALGASACTFHSTATHWNGRVGVDGQPVHLTTTTTYGFNLLVLLPFFGDTRTDSLVDACTAELAEQGSDRLRAVETESANWWYVLPPISWIVTPVMGSVSIEYTPSATALAEQQRLDALFEERTKARFEQDNRHVVPEPRR